MVNPGITIIGLGPGDPLLLTRQAIDALNNADEVYLRTKMHPSISGFPQGLSIHSFDHLYEQDIAFEEVYEKIVDTILDLGQRKSGVFYAVPGHPFVAEATTPDIVRRAKEIGLPIEVIEGLSFVEPVFGLLELDPFPQTSLVDGLELAIKHHPPFPPSVPALIAQIYSPSVASEVKLVLMAVYPDDHMVQLVHDAGSEDPRTETMELYKIDRNQNIGLQTVLYVPAMVSSTSFEGFQEVIAHLRAPDGCPWDREQTHLSLRPYLLEETYEVLAALDAEDQAALKEELGDLLLQIVLHAQIACEYGDFSMVDVIQGIQEKLIRRHPHVFGDLAVEDKQTVLENWEKLKLAERDGIEQGSNGVLKGVSAELPALVQAETFQQRVKRVGFDWPDIQGVYDKVAEELSEVKQSETADEVEDEIGDLLFAVVNLARWHNVDAESALRQANRKFRQRFEELESEISKQGMEFANLDIEELDQLWNRVKKGKLRDHTD
jgi:tetrapyrrole methylase family protein/MazG family protein